MPDARIEQSQGNAEQNASSLGTSARQKPSAFQYLFPYVACALVTSGIASVAYFMDRAAAEGRLTGMPYVLFALMVAAIFVAHYFVYRED